MIGSLVFDGERFERVRFQFEGNDNYARFFRLICRVNEAASLEDILILTGCRMEVGERDLVVRGFHLPDVQAGFGARLNHDYRFQEARFTPGVCDDNKRGMKR